MRHCEQLNGLTTTNLGTFEPSKIYHIEWFRNNEYQINTLAAVYMQIILSGRLECPLLSISNIRGGGVCKQKGAN